MRAFFLLSYGMRQISRHAANFRRDRTDVENKFWQAVRNRNLDGFKFRFQHSVLPYVADFACLEAMLIVELDGGQHADDTDAERTAYLGSKGFEVLRFWNSDVIDNFDGVMDTVHAALLRRAAEKK